MHNENIRVSNRIRTGVFSFRLIWGHNPVPSATRDIDTISAHFAGIEPAHQGFGVPIATLAEKCV